MNMGGRLRCGVLIKQRTVVRDIVRRHTFGETDFINMFTAKIAVIISDPNNNDVVSKTLTHEQHVLHNPTRTGTLEMQFLPLSMTVINTILSLDLMTTMVT